MELNIRKIVAYVDPSGRYYGQYIYIETVADKPTGLYPTHTNDYINRWKKEWGYYSEEYGVFKLLHLFRKNVSRNEYDDGHTRFLGKVVSPTQKNQELRERFITPYNLIITSQQSSFNCDQFYDSNEYFNKLLKNEMTIEEFNKYMKKFPKPMDRFY